MSYLLALVLIATVVTGYALLRWSRIRRVTRDRHRLEDALKHLFEQEYRGRHASLSSLAGALRLPAAAALALVGRMQAQQLVEARGQDFALTAEGRRLALQIVRAHRLLERYFADEARLPLPDVHRAAERQEHALSPTAADRLSAALGHPTHDPHGDPIPTRDGSVAPAAGTPATAWPAGTLGRVVHLEDEPEISFAQIVAAGLRVGQIVAVVESTPERLVLGDGEREFTLAPAVAANVFLAATPQSSWPARVIRLSDLADDLTAEIVDLDEACQGFSRRRLMDLGFTAGARIRPALKTFAGDPRAYLVRGTTIALRRDQANHILVRPTGDGAATGATPPASEPSERAAPTARGSADPAGEREGGSAGANPRGV